jgi:signal transduction histidine kinase
MPEQPADDLLKRFLQISTSSLPSEAKLDQILHSIAEKFQSDRCLLLKPDQILADGLFSRLVSERKALWVEDGVSFSRTNVRPEEEPFLLSAFVCLPLCDGHFFQGILYLGFPKPRHFRSEEVDLLSLIARGIGEVLRNAALHSEAEQTISKNALLYRNLEEVHRELKEAQVLLVHQEKMAALGELSNTMAHGIKNPLTAIGGFARRLDRAIPSGSAEKRYTKTIIEEVARIEKLLDDINLYTHHDPVAFHPLDLPPILEESLSTVTDKLAPGKIELIREYADEVPKVEGDHCQLKQAFSSLIRNACESMGQKGTLVLRVSPFSKNGVSCVRLEVKDSGKGIDPENLSNVFNPFYSTKESGPGLGLPVVHKIIASHRGRIEVDNRPGQGVTFLILFPAFRERVRNSSDGIKDRSSLVLGWGS